jgi:hypothetical protein
MDLIAFNNFKIFQLTPQSFFHMIQNYTLFAKRQFLTLVAVVLLGFQSNNLLAQANLASGGTTTQNFDPLTTTTWTNNTTLTGWYAKTDLTASITAYAANTGSTTTAGLYSFGSTSAADRDMFPQILIQAHQVLVRVTLDLE